MKLCSACLLGLRCRYNGKAKPDDKVRTLARHETLIPVCPEQLGGLATPRAAMEIYNGRVLDKDGHDFTREFEFGAQEVLQIARLYGINKALLKQNSPSCGCGRIYDGTFTGTVIKGDGITTKLLKQNGLLILTENDL